MRDPLVFPLPGNEPLAGALAGELSGEVGRLTVRRFPDGESYVRVDAPPAGRDVILACTLHQPDEKLLPLFFLAATLRELGAARVGLVAPYLAYMRQDRRFHDGEGVTSAYFARLVSGAVDWLATVDPHLHRRGTLAEIYSIPALVVHAAPLIVAWIREHVHRPLLVGPDAESEQWVRAVAALAGAPHVVLQKVRRGDRDVEVSVPEVERWRRSSTPVVVDDIISTARTMAETVGHLRRAGLEPPVCVGVHAVFAGHAYADLIGAGAGRVVTCNTIAHESNAIDVHGALADAVRRSAERGATPPAISRAAASVLTR